MIGRMTQRVGRLEEGYVMFGGKGYIKNAFLHHITYSFTLAHTHGSKLVFWPYLAVCVCDMREIRNHVKSLDHGVETRQVLGECIDAVLLGRWRDAGECAVFGSGSLGFLGSRLY